MASFFITSILVIALVGMLIGLPFFLNWLAGGNTLYTQVPEGKSKAILKNGTLDHFVMSLSGSHLNEPGTPWFDPSQPDWEVIENQNGEECDSRGGLTKWLGIYWVGIPPFRDVYSYHFSWSEMKQNEDRGTREMWARSEQTDFVYVTSFPYILMLDSAETKEGLPVTVMLQATIRIVNPYKALFDTEKWMEVVSGTIIGGARNFVGSMPYAELISETRALADNSLSTIIKRLNERFVDGSVGLHQRYGVIVESTDILTVDIAGENKKQILEATIARYTADQVAYTTRTAGEAKAAAILAEGKANAEVIILKGAADAGAIEAKGLAEAKALTARLAAWNNGGTLNALLAQVEAMASPGPNRTVVWANNPFVSKINGLAEALDTLGIKTPEELRKYFAEPTSPKEEEQSV